MKRAKTYGEVFERPCLFDVRKGSLEVLELRVDLLRRLLRLRYLLDI